MTSICQQTSPALSRGMEERVIKSLSRPGTGIGKRIIRGLGSLVGLGIEVSIDLVG